MAIRIYNGFDQLPESYAGFFEAVAKGDFYCSREWFSNLAQTALEANAEVRLYAVEDENTMGTPQALLITRAPAGQNGSIFSGRWIGRRTLAAMTNYQSIRFAPLISPSVKDSASVLRELVRNLCCETPRWSLIDLNLLDPQSTMFEILRNQLEAAGMVVRSYRYAANLFEPTSGLAYQDYLRSRPNNERRVIPRRRRRLEEAHRVRFEILTGGERLGSAIADYERVFAASWKKAESFPRFGPGLIRASAAAGALRLGLLYVDDEPAAAQLWIVAGSKATIHKLSYDERFKQFSVGSILTSHMMEHALDVERVREVDFGLFDGANKRAWMSKSRELYGLAAFNPKTVWGAIALVRFDMGRAWRVLLNVAKPVLKTLYESVRHYSDWFFKRRD